MPLQTTAESEESRNQEISVSLPADLIAALRIVQFQRQSLGQEQPSLDDLLQEALNDWLEREMDHATGITIRV